MINLTALDNVNASIGPQVFIEVPNQVTGGLFIGLVLFLVWMFIIGGSFYYQKKNTQTGNIAVGLAVSGFVIVVLTLVLRFAIKTGSQLVNGYHISFAMGVFIIGLFALFFTKDSRL